MKERPDNQLSPQELLERDQKLLEALCIITLLSIIAIWQRIPWSPSSEAH